VKPKNLIHNISEELLECFSNLNLIDRYDVYQHLMTYWNETMQDDVFVISDDGWKAGREVYRITRSANNKADKTKIREVEGLEGIESKLIKPNLIIDRYFATEKSEIEALASQRDSLSVQMEEMEEEHGGEEGLMAECRNDKDKITAASVKDRIKKISSGSLMKEPDEEESKVLKAYLKLADTQAVLNNKIKEQQKALETKVWNQYKELTDDTIKAIVVDDKWMKTMDAAIHTEMQRISQRLTQRIKELAERYETPLPLQLEELKLMEEKVNAHLAKMGFVWK
jgi:type I restriction enzyme M protein